MQNEKHSPVKVGIFGATMTELPPQYTDPVRSLSDYQNIVCDIFERWKTELGNSARAIPHLWFRGQSRNDPLLPGVLRECVNPNTGKVCKYNERKIHVTFTALYRNYTSERFQEKTSEFYSFMQHYGIPTRLLDWTENAAFALYFAVNNAAHDEDGVVWVMNPGALNQLTTEVVSYAPLVSDNPLIQARMRMVGYIKDEKLGDEFWDNELDFKRTMGNYLQYPIAFYPASSGNIRIAIQKGCFTIHGLDQRPIETVFDTPAISTHLLKVKIQKEAVTTIREQLKLMGVTARSVYPDITGLAYELSGVEYML